MRHEPITARCGPEQLYAVRHGESTANALFAGAARSGAVEIPLTCGDREVPLSARGAEQATALGAWLAGLAPEHSPDLVVCSPYLRARQTWEFMEAEAARLGTTPAETLVDERLRDREMGLLELLTPAAILAHAPDEARRRAGAGEWSYRPPGGESLADVAVRVGEFLTRLGTAPRGRRVLLVAHDAVVVALDHVIAGRGAPLPDEAAPVPNASVSRWRADDGHRLRLAEFGSVTHLSALAPGG